MSTKFAFPILIIIAVFVAYLNSLSNGFVWLDQAEILNGKLIISDFSAFLQMLFFDDNNYDGYHRPMYNLVHSMDYAIWGKNAFGFHLSSLVIHCANAVLLYFIVRNFSGNKLTSGFVALFFGLLPCHTATVSLIHSKADLLACFFILAPMYLYSKVALRGAMPSIAKILLWCFMLLLALLSKEVAIMLPFFVATLSYLLYRQGQSVSVALAGCPMLLGLIFIVYRLGATDSAVGSDAAALTDRLLSFVPVYVDYISRTLTSYELTTNDAVRVWSHIPTGIYVVYVLAFVALLVAQYHYAKKSIFIAAGFLWFNLFLIPVSQLIPILHFRADRFLYLPSIGFVFAVAFIFEYYYKRLQWERHKRVITYFLTILLVLSSVRIWQRNKDFSSDKVMFQKLIETHPACREAQGFVGNAYLVGGDFDKALFHINKALDKQPKYFSFVDRKSNSGNLGVVYMNQNKNQQALDVFLELESIGNYDREVVFNLGVCNKRLKNFAEAKSNFEEYLSYKPNNLDALFNLGAVGIELGDKDMVKKYFGLYLDLNPTSEYRADIEGILKSM